MILKNKKGISPVIATTLLILIAVIIALIIFLWVKAFIGENIQKDVGAGKEVIQNFCTDDQLKFSANVDLNTATNELEIFVQNSGNVPIQGVQVQVKGFASVKDLGSQDFPSPLTSGADGTITIPSGSVKSGDKVRIVAVLMGELNDGSKKKYACVKNFVEEAVN